MQCRRSGDKAPVRPMICRNLRAPTVSHIKGEWSHERWLNFLPFAYKRQISSHGLVLINLTVTLRSSILSLLETLRTSQSHHAAISNRPRNTRRQIYTSHGFVYGRCFLHDRSPTAYAVLSIATRPSGEEIFH